MKVQNIFGDIVCLKYENKVLLANFGYCYEKLTRTQLYKNHHRLIQFLIFWKVQVYLSFKNFHEPYYTEISDIQRNYVEVCTILRFLQRLRRLPQITTITGNDSCFHVLPAQLQ